MFNKSKSGYLNKNEFEEGMFKLFTEDYNYLSKFVFNFYDSDEDGKITPEDIRLTYSYFPLKQDRFSLMHKFSYEFPRLEDQLIAQEEIKKLIEWIFKKPELSFDIFYGYITKINIDPFIYLILILYFYRPFTDEILNYYDEINPKTVSLRNTLKLNERNSTKTKDNLLMNSSTDNNNKNMSAIKSQKSKKIKIKNVSMEENITILTPLPNLNTIFLAGTLLESNQFFRNVYNQSKKKLKLREPTVQLVPFHLQIIKSTIERNKEEAKNDIYGMIKEKEQEIETPYFIDKVEPGQTKFVSHYKEINKDAITQVTLLTDTEGIVLKAGKTEALKEVYIKIKANYMFIYERKPIDNKIIKHKSVKILNLCYLKYDKSEEDEPVGEGDNEIKRVKKIKNNGKNSLSKI